MLTMKTIGLGAAIKEITRINKNAKFAAVRALTRTAVAAKNDVREAMSGAFDHPTRYTLNSLFVQPATKKKPVARLGFKNIPNAKGRPALKYLEPVLEGKPRSHKGIESQLRKRGLLPAGAYAVPGRGVRLNKSGNVTQAQVIKILNGIGRGGKYFVANINGTHGIWERTRRGVKPMFVFVKKPAYSQEFDFFMTAEKSFEKCYNKEFDKSLKQALK